MNNYQTNRHYTKEETGKANGEVLSMVVTGEMHTGTTRGNHHVLEDTITKTDSSKCSRGYRPTGSLIPCWWVGSSTTMFGNDLAISNKVKYIHLP